MRMRRGRGGGTERCDVCGEEKPSAEVEIRGGGRPVCSTCHAEGRDREEKRDLTDEELAEQRRAYHREYDKKHRPDRERPDSRERYRRLHDADLERGMKNTHTKAVNESKREQES